MFRRFFKPVVADHSIKSARHFRLRSAFNITNYLIPYKPSLLRKMLFDFFNNLKNKHP